MVKPERFLIISIILITIASCTSEINIITQSSDEIKNKLLNYSFEESERLVIDYEDNIYFLMNNESGSDSKLIANDILLSTTGNVSCSPYSLTEIKKDSSKVSLDHLSFFRFRTPLQLQLTTPPLGYS